MKSKSRLGRISIVSTAGLVALGVAIASQTRLFADQPQSAGTQFTPPSSWVQADNYGWAKSWKGEEDRKAFVSIVEDDSMKAEVPNPNDQKFIEVLKSSSSVPNFIAGIKDWNVEKLERIHLPEGHKLVLLGTYLNYKGETVRFEEWKYFLKDGYGQINYSELAGPKARDRAQVAEILKRYHPFGT